MRPREPAASDHQRPRQRRRHATCGTAARAWAGVGLNNVERRLAASVRRDRRPHRSQRARSRAPSSTFACRQRPRPAKPPVDERQMSARLRIVIADDERPARSFLAALLRSFDDVVIVAEAESGCEAVAAIERERPDLALLDSADARARRHRCRPDAEDGRTCRSSRS